MQAVAQTPAAPGDQLTLTTTHGALVGTWRGSTAVGVNDELSVELDVEREYVLSEFDKVSAPDHFEPQPNGRTEITGLLEEVTVENLLVLRVAGTLVTFETKGQIPTDLVGSTHRVTVDDLQLYPTEI